MFTWLQGYKTYLVGGIMILVSGAHAEGYLSDQVYGTIVTLLTGAGLITLRAGISKASLKTIVILLLPLAMLSGCKTAAQTDTGLLSAGKSLDAIGTQFNLVSKVYLANCIPTTTGAVPAPGKSPEAFGSFCKGFHDFAPKFGQAYNPAVDAWKAAVAANDTSKIASAQATALQLTTDLSAVAGNILSALVTP